MINVDEALEENRCPFCGNPLDEAYRGEEKIFCEICDVVYTVETAKNIEEREKVIRDMFIKNHKNIDIGEYI